jgi:hypothetical protein
MFSECAQEVVNEFTRLTGRRVLTVEAHCDTNNVHLHFFHTRVDELTHDFLAGTVKGLSTVGDWACGVLRQKRYKVIHPQSKNARSAERYRQRVMGRNNGAEPVDNALNIAVDRVSEKWLGSPSNNPEIAGLFAEYVRRVPHMQLLRLIALACGMQKEIRLFQQALHLGEDVIRGYYAAQNRLINEPQGISLSR